MTRSDGFHDATGLAALHLLEVYADELREECLRVDPGAYSVWPEPAAVTGTWSVFPLYRVGSFADRCRRNGPLCPRTLARLAEIPSVLAAAYSRLGSGSHVHLHSDETSPPTIRCHLGIDVGGDASGLRIGSATRRHADGRAFGFESWRPHESFNGNVRERVVLVVDLDARRVR